MANEEITYYQCFHAEASESIFIWERVNNNICLCLQQVLKSDNNMRNSDVELQQRSIEYLQLSSITTPDVLVSEPLTNF